jgi:5'-nucleotidase
MLLTKNIHIIANFFKFDAKGRAVDYKKPLIHLFNKNEVEIKKTPYYREIEARNNVLLLGDSLGDLGMTEGLEHDNIIRIGFLNDKINQLLVDYAREFDLIILNDGPMDPVNKLLEKIVLH